MGNALAKQYYVPFPCIARLNYKLQLQNMFSLFIVKLVGHTVAFTYYLIYDSLIT